MSPTDANARIVTTADVDAMRLNYLAGNHAQVLADDKRLRKDGNWTTPPGISRSGLNERMNYFSSRSQELA